VGEWERGRERGRERGSGGERERGRGRIIDGFSHPLHQPNLQI